MIEIPIKLDAAKVANALDNREIASCRELADLVSSRAEKYLGSLEAAEVDAFHSYGILCATSPERNFLIALLTANAVKTAREKLRRPANVAELGMGSGINCIAALLADGYANVIGYEIDPATIAFAEAIIKDYGMAGRVDIRRQSFLEPNLNGTRLDVVVNENFSTTLTMEPLFEAANAILPHTHNGTLFVPHSIDIFAEGPFNLDSGRIVYLGRVNLSLENKPPIVLARELEHGQADPDYSPLIKMRYHLIDFRGEKILKSDIPYLELTSQYLLLRGSTHMDPSRMHRLEVSLYFNGSQAKEPLGIKCEISPIK